MIEKNDPEYGNNTIYFAIAVVATDFSQLTVRQ